MLKVTKTVLLLLFALSLSLQAKPKELSSSEIKQIEQLEIFKKAHIKVNKAYEMDSLYLLDVVVQGNKDEIFLTKDKKYIISGAVINTSNSLQVKIPLDLSILKGKEALVYGEGKDEYVLFTDLECPYCKKFESYLPMLKDKIKVKVFFFPLDFHPNAADMSIYVLSKKSNQERIDAMFDLKIGSDLSKVKNAKYNKAEWDKLSKKLDEQLELGAKLNVQGTPAIFDSEGNSIVWVNLLEKYGIDYK